MQPQGGRAAAAAAPQQTFSASVTGYLDAAPRPRIVNGKIVRGEALSSVPMASGAPSPNGSTGLTWAPSPPVIRRRAADEATVAAVAPAQQPSYGSAPGPAAEEEQSNYESHYGGGGADGGGGYAPAEYQAPQQQQQYHAAYPPAQQQQQRPSTSPSLPGRGTGITQSSNRFASGANQNAGNVSPFIPGPLPKFLFFSSHTAHVTPHWHYPTPPFFFPRNAGPH